MAAFNKFNDFVEQLGKKNHDLDVDTIKVFLTDELPLATDTVKGDMVEITAQFGYPAGGTDIQNAYTETGGLGTMTGVDVVFTASGGTFGPFRYAVLYNDSGVTKYLVGWWDYGSSISCNSGETFTVDFGASVLTVQ